MKNSEKVINYMLKNNCQLVQKWRYGIPQYRILKNNEEKSYPCVNEDVFCEILNKLYRVSDYEIPEGSIYKLKEN